MTPQVSVVMPVRDGARWLREALASVVGQTVVSWELLAVDDGSTDSTPAILAEFAGREPRIRVLTQQPLGLVAALNRALAEGRAPLLARLDADDRAAPERLDRQMRHLAANPQIGLLGTWAQKIDDAGRPLGQLKPATAPEELDRILLKSNPFVHSSVMMRTDLARRLGGYRAALRAGEDYDLWLRFAEAAKVANLPELLVQYRWHSASVTQRSAIRQAFSARLARRLARTRRETGNDPADALNAPPDWRSPEADAAFYADDAVLYRLFDWADPDFAPSADVDFSPLVARFDELNHAERALTAQAMLSYMERGRRSGARTARRQFLRLLLKRPGMVPRDAWKLLPSALLR